MLIYSAQFSQPCPTSLPMTVMFKAENNVSGVELWRIACAAIESKFPGELARCGVLTVQYVVNSDACYNEGSRCMRMIQKRFVNTSEDCLVCLMGVG